MGSEIYQGVPAKVLRTVSPSEDDPSQRDNPLLCVCSHPRSELANKAAVAAVLVRPSVQVKLRFMPSTSQIREWAH